MIAKGLSNARTLRLNWFAAVKISDLEKIEGFGKDPPQVLLDIAAEIYLEAIVPESQRLFIKSLSTRTLEQLDALTDTVLSIFDLQNNLATPISDTLMPAVSSISLVAIISSCVSLADTPCLHTRWRFIPSDRSSSTSYRKTH